MSSTTDTAALAPQARGRLDDLMLAMDVVDTLRHREDLVTRELNDAGREAALIERLRTLYRQQGIEVPDHILRDGVKALEESRFAYTPPGPGLKRSLATLWVKRSTYGKRIGGALAALLIGWGVYQVAVVMPRQQAEVTARTELTQTLPARLANAYTDVTRVTTEQAALTRAQTLRADGERALRDGDRAAANRAITDLGSLREQLVQEYVLTIVSRPGADTGVWRRPPRSSTGRNYYLIVEAIAPDGRKLVLPIRNEETGATESVSMFGVRVPQEMFERVARDKREDGIVQFNRFAVKRRGTLALDYQMPFKGGMITAW